MIPPASVACPIGQPFGSPPHSIALPISRPTEDSKSDRHCRGICPADCFPKARYGDMCRESGV